MVEVSGGLLPVDGDGVLLPSDDFSPAEARKYPRLAEVKTVPIGPQGHSLGRCPRDRRSAKLAALLTTDWQAFKLARIVPTVPPAGVRSNDDISYELISQGGSSHSVGTLRRAANGPAIQRPPTSSNGCSATSASTDRSRPPTAPKRWICAAAATLWPPRARRSNRCARIAE